VIAATCPARFILSDHQTTNNDIRLLREPFSFRADGQRHGAGAKNRLARARRKACANSIQFSNVRIFEPTGLALPNSIRYEWLMRMLANWKRKWERERSLADVRKYQRQEDRRELILEWYRLLKPFHRRQLDALANDLSRNAIHDMVWQFIYLGGAWTVILVLLYWLQGQREGLLLFGPLGYVGIIAFIFYVAKSNMCIRLKRYAEGYWVGRDPFTGKQIYPLIECPKCKNRYLRYLEPCQYCGHNIDWEAAKIKH
jgi:hypothetical protein